jgi:spermidine/putrescine-binding protein
VYCSPAPRLLAAPYVWSRPARAAAHVWSRPARAAAVVVRNPGGAYDEAQRKYIYDPFTKETGIEVVVVPARWPSCWRW